MNKKIFILHGWTYSTDAWNECIAHLEKCGYEIKMLNVPGLTAESADVWNLKKYVAWLDQELSQEQDVTLICHSNGGRIALAYAAQYGQYSRISRLILIDAAGIRHNEFALRMKRVVFGSMAKVGKSITQSPTVRKIFYRLIGARDYERAPEHMRKTMQNLLEIDLTPELSKIKVPTLIIWGQQDTATPASDAKIMHTVIVGSKLEIIPDAGHSPHKTHAECVAKAINTWLKS